MKIAKPLLLISTPVGLAGGLYEAFRLAGGLAFIMVALVLVISAAMTMVIMTIRRERLAEFEARRTPLDPSREVTGTAT
jgi:hypothetical protein